MNVEIVLNAVSIGVGSGIGSYFGTRIAERGMTSPQIWLHYLPARISEPEAIWDMVHNPQQQGKRKETHCDFS